MAGDDYGALLAQIWQALGRVEQKVDSVDEKIDDVKETAKENTRERDRKLDEQNVKLDHLARRQESDASSAARVQERMVGQIDEVRRDVKIVGQKVDGQEKRLGALEAPVRKALQARVSRRKSLLTIVSIVTGVSSLVWVVLGPLWSEIAAHLARRLFGGAG